MICLNGSSKHLRSHKDHRRHGDNMASLIYGVKEAGSVNGKPKFTIDRILGLDKKEHRKIKPYRPWAGSPVKHFNNLTFSTVLHLHYADVFFLVYFRFAPGTKMHHA